MTMPRRALLFAAVLLAASAAAVSGFHLAGDESGLVRGVLTAVRERAEAEAEDAARFAVAYHNRNQGAALEFTRVLKSKRQVVTGTLHDLILEAADAGKKSLYRAKVWVKPWEDFKSVVEFRLAGDSESEPEPSVASDEGSGQGVAKLSLEADIIHEEAHLHTIENDGLSSDFASSA
ncbi:Cysteine proteinase inhibitor 3 [Zea mays]|uniref:Cysteine proteinase inhibitor n=3 Tax=Zea mays TaxID=4577 RepID=A0A9F2IDQ9_MAIZE|nr:multicystatin precursor [Zea mays]ACF85579.1 unknown [Zea mays]ACG48765.1 multicystatin [Zea mays]AQK93786.1 Cysteine proteinase inhibitor 6 [Zea mays]AQK93787.1 Cysteine proteinase inhibitor 6 [Zea mays]AQK93788.1 Cysteine proteinase inhibitor 6 [Zea mays]|eukprot:NP_001141159.1 multicystatin precursor [Zea mays]